MKRLCADIEAMRLGRRLIYSPPDHRYGKEVPATIQVIFPKQLSFEEVRRAADITNLAHSMHGNLVVVEGAGFRIHVAKPTRKGTFLQIQRTEMEEDLPTRVKAYEFMLNLPTNRKRDLIGKVAQLFANLRR